MLNTTEVRLLALVLSILFVGAVVQACRERPKLVNDPSRKIIEEVKFRQPEHTQASE